ncbi:hypothetical protein DAI22_07g209900 [Oryza sativa Japonica Group]|nr:hypothetical protein DAI22_07g209900 [Oryza sativa Japonica Group]
MQHRASSLHHDGAPGPMAPPSAAYDEPAPPEHPQPKCGFIAGFFMALCCCCLVDEMLM